MNFDSLHWKWLRFKRKLWTWTGYTYFHNRFVCSTHALRTGLKKGKWWDVDHRITHALLNEFILFFEEEVVANCKSGGWETSKGLTPEQTALHWLDVQAEPWHCERRTEYDKLAALYKEAKEHLAALRGDEPIFLTETGMYDFDKEQEWDEKETKLLQEIIKYRKYLWT